MDKVFISYSHADANFADRLVQDLRASEVQATYDRWLLRVGDSIIQKIATEVSESDRVIALLSPASIESSWVKKELSLAMMGEINASGVKVLPALIVDCKLPSMLADKFYADFRGSYYFGFRRLLEALLPSFYGYEKLIRKEQIEAAHRRLGEIIDCGNRDMVCTWFCSNGFALASLFGRLWAVSEALPRFPVGTEISDFLVINGQSGRYELSLIALGNISWSIAEKGTAREEVRRLLHMLQWCSKNEEELRHTIALRMASNYGAGQISPDALFGNGRRLQIDAKLLLGRRKVYGKEENKFRNDIYDVTNNFVDIISYDRVVEATLKLLSGPFGQYS